MLVLINGFITLCTYGIALFFLISIVRAFLKTKNVQDAINNALESMAGINIAAVNVNVCGIVRQ